MLKNALNLKRGVILYIFVAIERGYCGFVMTLSKATSIPQHTRSKFNNKVNDLELNIIWLYF